MTRRCFLAAGAAAPAAAQIARPSFQGAFARRQFDGHPRFPLFVDVWESFFRGSYCDAPAGSANWSDYNGQLTVTGAAGARTLTVNSVDAGTAADYAGEWACVILHDDGSYECYSAKNANAASIDIYPSLRAAATAKPLGNLHQATNGQHPTRMGCEALAAHLFASTKRYAYLEEYAVMRSYDSAGTALGTPFTAAGGLTTGGYVPGTSIYKGLFQPATSNPWSAPPGAVPYSGADRTWITGLPRATRWATSAAGQGCTLTAALGGRSGYFETTVAVAGEHPGAEASPIRVVLTVDGITVVNELVAGLTRIVAPFTNASSSTVTITAEAASTATTCKIGPTGWYVWQDADWGSAAPTDRVLTPGKRVVVMMDSWGAIHNNALVTKLRDLFHAAEAGSGDLIWNVSEGGATAAWALANYDALAQPHRPDYVVFNFQINDLNGGLSSAQWLQAARDLNGHALARGATPVWVRGPVTASQSQTTGLCSYQQELMARYPQAAF